MWNHLHTTKTGVVFSTLQGLFIHLLLSSLTSLQKNSFQTNPEDYLIHSSVTPLVTPFILLKKGIGPWPTVCLTIIFMHHWCRWSIQYPGPSLPWPSHSMIFLSLHLNHPFPWSSLYLINTTTFNYTPLSGYHFLFSSFFPLIISLQFFKVIRASNPLIHVIPYELGYNDPSSESPCCTYHHFLNSFTPSYFTG